MPDRPNGRVSHDGGLTWEKQKLLMPPGEIYQTDDRDVGCWFRGFEVPGEPGVFKVATWWSSDVGQTWRGHSWTTVRYPGAKGMDTYDPPEEFREQDGNFLRGGVKPSPPAHLEPFFKEVSRLKLGLHPAVCPHAEGPDGTLYSMSYGRYLQNTSGIEDGDRQYWQRLNWYRYAVLMQVSRDRGRTWEFAGVPVDGSDYEPRIAVTPGGNVYSRDFFVANPPDQLGAGFKGRVDFEPGDGFSEPSLVIFPDGEMLCALRTGSNKPLYSIRSHDGGRTWTKAELLSPRSVTPICGLLPKLVLLENGVFALFTGRPDCTFHFSTDRGRTWFPKETLFSMTSIPFDGLYSASHCNNSMIAVGGDTLLLVHDATRPDPSAPNPWLQKAGHGIIIARRITIHA